MAAKAQTTASRASALAIICCVRSGGKSARVLSASTIPHRLSLAAHGAVVPLVWKFPLPELGCWEGLHEEPTGAGRGPRPGRPVCKCRSRMQAAVMGAPPRGLAQTVDRVLTFLTRQCCSATRYGFGGESGGATPVTDRTKSAPWMKGRPLGGRRRSRSSRPVRRGRQVRRTPRGQRTARRWPRRRIAPQRECGTATRKVLRHGQATGRARARGGRAGPRRHAPRPARCYW